VTTTTQIEHALNDVNSMLGADGYQLVVRDADESRVVLSIVASPDACEECLVPPEILNAVVAKHLRQGGVSLSAEILYPGE
jgi:hypothetical protein